MAHRQPTFRITVKGDLLLVEQSGSWRGGSLETRPAASPIKDLRMLDSSSHQLLPIVIPAFEISDSDFS
jgi:hypothetical protein